MVPQGIMGPVMQLPFDVSGMTIAPIDIQRTGPVGPVPMSALASALASTTPDNQLVVCKFFLSNYLF